MKIGKILFWIALILNYEISFAQTAWEKVKEFDKNLFVLSQQEKVHNIFGKVSFSNLRPILESKALINPRDIEVYFYWVKNTKGNLFDLEIKGKISEEIKEIIKDVLSSKLQIFLGETLTEYIGTDDLSYEDRNIKATDMGAAEANERLLNIQKMKLNIIEKKPSGTITTNYHFIPNKDGVLIKNLEQSAYEGIQATLIKTNLSHQMINGLPVLEKMETQLEQRLFRTAEDDLEVTRELTEIIEFSQVEINSDKVSSWFRKK